MTVENNRLETGHVVCLRRDGDNDYRGVFIRGDNAFSFGHSLKTLLDKNGEFPDKHILMELAELLIETNQIEFPDIPEQMIQFRK